MKGWTEDPMQAHPSSYEAFDAFLRKRAAEAMSAYGEPEPGIDWAKAFLLAAFLFFSVAVWMLAFIGLAAVIDYLV